MPSSNKQLANGIAVVAIVLLAISRGIACAAAVDCPAPCKCSWVLDGLKVDCANSGLVEAPDFSEMPIEYLDLSNNLLTLFPSQLAEMATLVSLDLSNNRISTLTPNALKGFDALQILLLANNSFTSWADLSSTVAFQRAPNLRLLSLSGNQLGALVDDDQLNCVLCCSSLLELELEACGITAVSANVLSNGLINLQRLKLSRNPLVALTMLNSSSLLVLELDGCRLQHFDLGDLLRGLQNLEVLNLAWNGALQLRTASPSSLTYANNLKQLNASFCNLDSIDLGILHSLEVVRLRGNMLRTLSATTFTNNTLLEAIDLSRNSLRVLSSSIFQVLAFLQRIDLSYNEIARLDANLFQANTALVELNLSHNVFEKISRLNSISLQRIDISWCEISAIDSNALSGLTQLQRADLSNNWLRFIPDGLDSATLRYFDLSNCKLSNVRNRTFEGLPKLADLRLNGNRFTNAFPVAYFSSNKYLTALWVGDNPWICNCDDKTFVDFYTYLTTMPEKLKDKSNLRCASPTPYYGRTWDNACAKAWTVEPDNSGQIWTAIMCVLLVLGVLLCMASCLQKCMRSRKERNDNREFRHNQEELQEIRRQNQRMLQEEGTPNAPDPYESNLPSYEDALSMPKPVKSKSEFDLTASNKAQKRLRRSRTQQSSDDAEMGELMLDNKQRFRSEEMLSNREKERTQPMEAFPRTGYIERTASGSRRFSIEDSRFPASYVKQQNMQSAEKIGNFQGYEYSPYTKRKPKVAEIPPFKRATQQSESVEFLTDPEFDANSKPGSPFARRKPKISGTSPVPAMRSNYADAIDGIRDGAGRLDPAVEDYFAAPPNSSSNSSVAEGSFHVLVEADVTSLQDDTSSYSGVDMDVELGKRNKRERPIDRNVNATATDNNSSNSERDDMVVVVHKPLHETLF